MRAMPCGKFLYIVHLFEKILEYSFSTKFLGQIFKYKNIYNKIFTRENRGDKILVPKFGDKFFSTKS